MKNTALEKSLLTLLTDIICFLRNRWWSPEWLRIFSERIELWTMHLLWVSIVKRKLELLLTGFIPQKAKDDIIQRKNMIIAPVSNGTKTGLSIQLHFEAWFKNQVFINDEGDYYRTAWPILSKLLRSGVHSPGHSAEMKIWSKRFASHMTWDNPPFGHSGETTLAKLMTDFGSFNHNHHTLANCDKIGKTLSGFRRVEPLLWDTGRNCEARNRVWCLRRSGIQSTELRGPLEAQIANVADEFAYGAHIWWRLRSGILTFDMCEDLLVWKLIANELHWVGPKLTTLTGTVLFRELTNLEYPMHFIPPRKNFFE